MAGAAAAIAAAAAAADVTGGGFGVVDEDDLDEPEWPFPPPLLLPRGTPDRGNNRF